MNATQIDPTAVYIPSGDVVARDVEGEIIIVPLTAGIGDLEDDLFSLNDTGRAIWQYLDGAHTVAQVIAEVAGKYDKPADEIAPPVLAFLQELLSRKIIVNKA